MHLQALPSVPRVPAKYGPTRTVQQTFAPARIASNLDITFMVGCDLPKVGNVLNLERHRARKAGRAWAQSILGPDFDGPRAA